MLFGTARRAIDAEGDSCATATSMGVGAAPSAGAAVPISVARRCRVCPAFPTVGKAFVLGEAAGAIADRCSVCFGNCDMSRMVGKRWAAARTVDWLVDRRGRLAVAADRSGSDSD